MSEEIQNNRRRQAQQDLGLDHSKEQKQMERAMQKEEERKRKKEQRRKEIEQSSSYKATKNIAKVMDNFLLDPILGLIPGIGDTLPTVFVIPFIYVAACKVRSLPLTLAIIYNALRDMAIGLIPFWIGNILDFFNRSYKANFKLIVGFVEDDKDVIHEVNRKAAWTGFLIIVFCVIIYYLVKFVVYIGTVISDFFSNLF